MQRSTGRDAGGAGGSATARALVVDPCWHGRIAAQTKRALLQSRVLASFTAKCSVSSELHAVARVCGKGALEKLVSGWGWCAVTSLKQRRMMARMAILALMRTMAAIVRHPRALVVARTALAGGTQVCKRV